MSLTSMVEITSAKSACTFKWVITKTLAPIRFVLKFAGQMGL
jgi:hypothetical protein